MPDSLPMRFTIKVRRAAPGDNAWPCRWRVELYDDDHYDTWDGHRRRGDWTMTERGAHRAAHRWIKGILRSEETAHEVQVDG